MASKLARIAKARSKGHVGHSGDGDMAALEGRRARTAAARTARASKRLQEAVTGIADTLATSRAAPTYVQQLTQRLDQQQAQIQALGAEIAALKQ
jgi:hypothetical protein